MLDGPHLGTPHLTEEQFSELLACSAEAAAPEATPAQAHLLLCEACATELASLRESLSLFRQASSAYADDQLRHRPRWTIPDRRALPSTLVRAYWVAAAAMFLTALLPLQVLRRHSVQSPPAVAASVAERSSQSDEALLEDVNREISASVPTPMQALADPTATAASSSIATSNPTSNQRKD